jgi:serine/threonine protein kinase/tetratricopeptide (TPR) repeat protein
MTSKHQSSAAGTGWASDLIGRTFGGDFEILSEIGRGGMGVVFKARQVSLDRMVAFKVLSQNLGLTDQAVARFRREAQATAKLHHPNIVPIYAQGNEGETYYYAMELVEGTSLYDIISEMRGTSPGDRMGGSARVKTGGSSVAPDMALAETELLPGGSGTDRLGTGSGGRGSVGRGSRGSRIEEDPRFARYDEAFFDSIARQIRDVADALDYAHRHGVIHRDIKPHNLMEGHNQRLCLTDFGLARVLEQPGMTQTGEFVGSPLYMSPEQITGRGGPVGVASDIYSLGATLYEWLTLSPPFPGATREQVISQVITSESLPPRSRNRRVPLDLETICTKALEKDPSKRYKSAADLRDDLTRFLGRGKIKAQRAGVFKSAAKVISRRRLAATVVGFACIVAALSFMLIKERRTTRELETIADARRVEPQRPTPAPIAESGPTPTLAPATTNRMLEDRLNIGKQLAEMIKPSVLTGIFTTGDSETGEVKPYESVTVGQRIGAMYVVADREAKQGQLQALKNGELDANSSEGLYLQALDATTAGIALAKLNASIHAATDARAALLLHAWILCQLDRPDDMLADIEIVLGEFDVMPADEAYSAEALMTRAAARILKGEYESALADLDALPKSTARDYRVKVLTGIAHEGEGNHDDALLAYGEALTFNPECVLARMRSAKLYLKRDKPDTALAHLDFVLTVEPGNADALELRGQGYDQNKQYAEAFADYLAAYDISHRAELIPKAGFAQINLQASKGESSSAKESKNENDAEPNPQMEPKDAQKQDLFPKADPSGKTGAVLDRLKNAIDGVSVFFSPRLWSNSRADRGNLKRVLPKTQSREPNPPFARTNASPHEQCA